MSVKGILIVDGNNRVLGIKYGPYTSADLEPENEYLLEAESFPDQGPIQALYNPADSTFTYDDVWTTAQETSMSSTTVEPTE